MKLRTGILGAIATTLVVAVLLYEAARIRPHTVHTPQLGDVREFPAWLRQRGFVYLFSGASGWSDSDEQVALAFSRTGHAVTGIDTQSFIRLLNRTTPSCVFLPGMLEDYSHAQQRKAATARFAAPILLGHDAGGTLVYLAQIQAPELAFSAAVAVDPEPRIALLRPLCDHEPAARDSVSQTVKPEALGPNVPARIAQDLHATPPESEFAAAVARQLDDQRSVATRPVSGSLRAIYEAALTDINSDRQHSALADLPLVEVPAARPVGDAFGVLYSGDGGWRDLDRTLAGILASKGVSVVGVDVLRYYWRRKSPSVAADDLARIIRHYQQVWHRKRVLLIGFSFGADVLPFMVNRLPPDIRSSVGLLSLLSPERTAAFEIEPTAWFGGHGDAESPLAPELRPLSSIHVQCVYGEDEADDSLCTMPAATMFSVLRKSGGHHFDQNYDALAEEILAAALWTPIRGARSLHANDREVPLESSPAN